MRTLAQPATGWFTNDIMQVAGPKGRATMLGVTVAIASLAGTGGISDSNFWLKRQSRGYSVEYFQGIDLNTVPVARTSTENLARVRDILKPTVSNLAALIGVSRQAIYNWQAGEQPKSEHLASLEDLAKAADVIAAEGLRHPSQLLKRNISNGQNLLDIVRAGGSASETAKKLVQIVRREEQQRKALDARFAGRKHPPLDHADMGVPNMNEQA